MHNDSFAVQRVPSIMDLTDLMLGGIVLCCSTIGNGTIKACTITSSSRSFRSFPPLEWSAAVNGWADCSITTTAKLPDERR